MGHPALSLHRPSAGCQQRLFCFPHAGGGASAFRGLKAALQPEGIELCALQAPGRENRISHPLIHTAAEMVDHFEQAIATLDPMPFSFLGHSMGSLIAFLLSRQLQRKEKTQPARLIVSASLSPSTRNETRNSYKLSDDAFKKKVFAHGGVPEQFRQMPELMDIFLPVLRADYEVFDRYLHEDATRVTIPVSVYAGVTDEAVPLEEHKYWQDVAEAPVNTRHFSGGHFYLYQQLDDVKAALLQDLI